MHLLWLFCMFCLKFFALLLFSKFWWISFVKRFFNIYINGFWSINTIVARDCYFTTILLFCDCCFTTGSITRNHSSKAICTLALIRHVKRNFYKTEFVAKKIVHKSLIGWFQLGRINTICFGFRTTSSKMLWNPVWKLNFWLHETKLTELEH